MKYENSIKFEEFADMIKKNKKLGQKKKSKTKKKMSKYIFNGPVINEAQGDEEQESDDVKNNIEGDNEEEENEKEDDKENNNINNKEEINNNKKDEKLNSNISEQETNGIN